MKNIRPLKAILLFFVSCASLGLHAQKLKTIHYTPTEVFEHNINAIGPVQITANAYKLYQIDTEVLKSQLIGIAQREDESQGFTALISFPHPDGTMHEYKALGNRTLSKELGDKYPEIKTYDAADTKGNKVKWDITPKGLHVMIMLAGESTIFIDPLIDGDNEHYIVYHKKDFTTDKIMNCEFNSDASNLKPQKNPVNGTLKTFGTCDLRTYRLALAATAEYTIFHGGSVANAQAAQAVSMNRVNGVFERDMAITMTIVGNNNLIIYTNSGSDPYSNGNPGSMINQNQSNCDAVIGNSNYDIGHVFGTNSGGLAGLGVVCSNSNKARGVTGSSAPIGDTFDIDYVAHEMGHQFGANHTQNNPCNSVSATRVEPGSASTIMGYAGICAPNVQSNSDDHFHGISLEEIGVEIMSGSHTCELITSIANNAPSIVGTNGNITIPVSTPFALSGSVFDADGDPILYCWEQIDNQASTQPPSPTSTNGPNFRSNLPVLDSTRYFPNLAAVAAGTSPTWEVIPSVSRTMNFRLTVRDQGLNVPGCNDHEDVTVTFDAGSGPFVVLYPSVSSIVWTGLTSETVTWDVANTNVAPVNCANVDILLSTDGGLTYPFTLATGVSNDGTESITVPSVATTTARVMVINSSGTFFDISDNDFEITIPICNSPDLPTVSGTTSICDGQSTTLTVTAGSLNDASNWEWYEVSCGGTAISSGTSISVSPSATTSYFVRGEGGCVVPGSCTETVVAVNPIYNINEAASICQGQSYTYPDGTLGTASESYTSSLNSLAGCDSTIVTALTVLTSFNMNESAFICDGDSYTFPDGSTATTAQSNTSTLSSTGGCDSVIVTTLTVNSLSTQNVNAAICDGEVYTFPDGSTGASSQTQTSVIADINGCDSTIITNLTLTIVDISVTLLLPGLQANSAGATYQWLDCDNGNSLISGATNQIFTPTLPVGSYAVIVNEGGCVDTSICNTVDQAGMTDLEGFKVNIYPNPASDMVNINWEGKVTSIELTDARGRVLKVINSHAVSSIALDISEYSKGVYFIHLHTQDGRLVRELVKE